MPSILTYGLNKNTPLIWVFLLFFLMAKGAFKVSETSKILNLRLEEHSFLSPEIKCSSPHTAI